jgi:protein-L-isoaspartate(D-aspartate) O-methyltransferase
MITAIVLGLVSISAGGSDDAAERADMVQTIELHARTAASALGRESIDRRVLEVIGALPRHEFVPPSYRSIAYADRPAPIGFGQTISQPFIVALMTDLLNAKPEHVVLEIGTGSGYQAAVLSRLVRRVCTIEIVPGLGESAARRIATMGLTNVETKIGDGYYGWPDAGPFDGILVTAAASHIPPPLIQQLKPGGRMVIPVGGPFSLQYLMLVEKGLSGDLRTRQLLPVAFVPLTGAR